jgi:hypothetical protein
MAGIGHMHHIININEVLSLVEMTHVTPGHEYE